MEMSVCLGNEKEDGEEREDEKHGHVQLFDDIWFGKYRGETAQLLFIL
jgi:hypothetical protein